jgi:hypothetical protein
VRDNVFVDVEVAELVRVVIADLDGKVDRDELAVADDELDASTPTPANFRDTGFAAGCSATGDASSSCGVEASAGSAAAETVIRLKISLRASAKDIAEGRLASLTRTLFSTASGPAASTRARRALAKRARDATRDTAPLHAATTNMKIITAVCRGNVVIAIAAPYRGSVQ